MSTIPTAEEREEEKAAEAYAGDASLYKHGDVKPAYIAGSRDTKRQMLAGISEAREELRPLVDSQTFISGRAKVERALAILSKLIE